MSLGLYYTPPPEAVFLEMKVAAIAEWQTHNNDYGYVDEKVGRIKDIKNAGDNFMYMLAMFDMDGQREVIRRLSDEARSEAAARLVAGGADAYQLAALGL
jgi:hypothetical protein